MVHVYNGIFLTYKKECIWVSFNEVDEPRAYYTEWSKKEKEKYYILTYICIHIWNLGKGTDECICRAAMEMQT